MFIDFKNAKSDKLIKVVKLIVEKDKKFDYYRI